jgi:serine/threonine-protein kinase
MDDERHPAFSPDGRWLAYSSNESGTFQVYVKAFPDKGGRLQVSNNGGLYPHWSRNGRELFFRTEDNRIMVVTYTTKGDSFAGGKPQPWSNKQLANVGITRNYDLAPDGKHIAALMPAEAPEDKKATNHVTLLLNFFDELRRRVPVNK